jgi:hypothetical protein
LESAREVSYGAVQQAGEIDGLLAGSLGRTQFVPLDISLTGHFFPTLKHFEHGPRINAVGPAAGSVPACRRGDGTFNLTADDPCHALDPRRFGRRTFGWCINRVGDLPVAQRKGMNFHASPSS